MPVGGIGTGDICLGGNGQWRDVEIMNKPGIGFYGSASAKMAPCFLVFVQTPSGRKITRALMGPVPPSEYQGMQGSEGPNNGFPRFSHAAFDAAYPFGTVSLEDPEIPLTARVMAFNPFIPGDPEASGIPVAVIRYELTNRTKDPLVVAVAGSLDNFIGMDGSQVAWDNFQHVLYPVGARNNKNLYRRVGAIAGIFMRSDSVVRTAAAWGTVALTTMIPDSSTEVSYRTELDPKGWNSDVSDLWNDFSDDGRFHDSVFASKKDAPHAALALRFRLAPGESRTVPFLLSWVFPNRKDWQDSQTVGNYYATRYADAWDVAGQTWPRLPKLEAATLDFVRTFLRSDYPAVFKEAALFNSSTLRSQTVFRTPDGNLFGWEGVFNSTGSCYGNCTHVWNYEEATPFLFGNLAMTMRQLEFQYGLNDSTGLMSFRIALPLNKANNWKVAAADGQMGTIMKIYREWQLSGDRSFLVSQWPLVKKALSFAWVKGGWDADRDGVMEGCQHNTMDIEYFGPNPEIEFWYLGALRAGAAMAGYLQDSSFQNTCRGLFASGSRWVDQHLFNGQYYIQQVRPVADRSEIAPGLVAGMGASDFKNPDFQIGEGCLVDQLAGQCMAHLCGLGWLADSAHLRKSLLSIRKYNAVSSFNGQFNNMRTYALGAESGLVLTAYPDPAKKPAIPLSYASEAWTGLEYTAAVEMIYNDLLTEALATVTQVRNRYDGSHRNPFNEEECGNHYARAMASWGLIPAYSGFHYSAVTGSFSMNDRAGTYFWSNGHSWGSAEIDRDQAGKRRLRITVHYGELQLRSVKLAGMPAQDLPKGITLQSGESRSFSFYLREKT